MRIKVRQRGQLTLPEPLRKSYGIREGSIINIFSLGSSIVMKPGALAVEKLQNTAKQELIDRGVTLEEMLKGLETVRKQYNAEHYNLKDS